MAINQILFLVSGDYVLFMETLLALKFHMNVISIIE